MGFEADSFAAPVYTSGTVERAPHPMLQTQHLIAIKGLELDEV